MSAKSSTSIPQKTQKQLNKIKNGQQVNALNWSTSLCPFASTQKGPFCCIPFHHFEGRQTKGRAKRPHK
jgi:hypothetical protein